jgi:hypothetical protein
MQQRGGNRNALALSVLLLPQRSLQSFRNAPRCKERFEFRGPSCARSAAARSALVHS